MARSLDESMQAFNRDKGLLAGFQWIWAMKNTVFIHGSQTHELGLLKIVTFSRTGSPNMTSPLLGL